MAPTFSATDHSELHRRLLLLTALRSAVVTGLLVITAAASFSSHGGLAEPFPQWLFGIAVGAYSLILGCAIAIRLRWSLTAVAYAQVAGDVALAVAAVYLTGGATSFFVFMFPLVVVNASVLLFRIGAFVAATASAIAFTATAWLINSRSISLAAPQLAGSPLSGPDLALSAVANVSAMFLTAVLASYLAEQLRSARQRLSQSEARYEALEGLHSFIVESVSSGIATTDAAGGLTYLNPAGEQILRRRIQEIQGRPVTEVFGATVTATGAAPVRGELKITLPSGEVLELGYSVSTLQRGGPGMVIAFQDLTQIRSMEAAVRRAEHLSALGQMAAGLAHEVRNPVGAMVGAIGLLTSSRGNGEDGRLLEILRREAERLNHLVTDFLAFARPSPANLAPLDLEPFVRDLVEVFRHHPAAEGVRIDVELTPVAVLGDAEVLRGALWNVLINAVQAMAGREGRVAISLRSEHRECVIEVSDDGAGIPEGNLPRIFDPFFSTKEQGTGLGLSQVHAGVHAMGGRVTVRTRKGSGTTFGIRIPILERSGQSLRKAAS